MITKKMQDAINDQINRELYSEYFYLAIAAYFNSIDLEGFENFFLVQVQEERFHAMKMYDFVSERKGRVTLAEIGAPAADFSSPREAFEATLAHEEYVTKCINSLVEIAEEENDYATQTFLNWFVDEQVEEEDTVGKILNKLKYVDGDGHGLLMLNDELSQRTFSEPASNE
jgi:ferritin